MLLSKNFLLYTYNYSLYKIIYINTNFPVSNSRISTNIN